MYAERFGRPRDCRAGREGILAIAMSYLTPRTEYPDPTCGRLGDLAFEPSWRTRRSVGRLRGGDVSRPPNYGCSTPSMEQAAGFDEAPSATFR